MFQLFTLSLVILLLVLSASNAQEKKMGLLGKLKKLFGGKKSGAVSKNAATSGVPIIDIGPLFGSDAEQKLSVTQAIAKACEEIGFFVIINHGVSDSVIENMWKQTHDFFDLDVEEKSQLIKPQHEYPFGYTRMKGEVLSAGKQIEKGNSTETAPPDLKEMFSLGPGNPDAGMPARLFPEQPTQFEEAWTTYYDTLAELARTILRSFAVALELESETFFDQFLDHHASALRALNYPHLVDEKPVPGQLRASAHTDYGTITILRTDAPGLEVSKDTDPPTWVAVPYVENGFIVNLGDLMKRWTNDKWLSTLHRVVNPPEQACSDGDKEKNDSEESTRRQSVAFFHNVNRDAVIENLAKEEAKYESIIAGDFLMMKHLATVGHLEETSDTTK
jgi:isopenicillin N synthase-like dioxygenase